MSYINNPDITKEDILKKSLAHWNVGKTQEWIDRDMAIVMGKREGYYFWDMDVCLMSEILFIHWEQPMQ